MSISRQEHGRSCRRPELTCGSRQTRLVTWTGLTFSVGPQVVAFGPFPASATAPVEYLMIGGLWQGASGEVSLFFGEHLSGDLHLLTSADRGTTWH